MAWYKIIDEPGTFQTGPVDYSDQDFDALFVRIGVYDNLEAMLDNVERLHGRFWITSEGSGYGKSTMLHFIARWLLMNLPAKKMIPLYVRHSGARGEASQRQSFIQELLHQVYSIGKMITRFAAVRKPEGLALELVTLFEKYSDRAKELRDGAFARTEAECEAWLREQVDETFSVLKQRGIRVVLLVDEIDKLDSEDIQEFLGRNQGLFEDLCEKSGFVIFFTGHKSWVDRIAEGTEYSYYHSARPPFTIPPLVDARDVGRLIETRQWQFAQLVPRESPWTDAALKEIMDITGGVPRDIILLSSEVLNAAYKEHKVEIGEGFVRGVVAKGRGGRAIKNHIEKSSELYDKLNKAREKNVLQLLPYIYYSPNHRVPRAYDTDMFQRTRVLTTEIGDKEWIDGIEKLSQLECVETRKTYYEISDDIVVLFDMMSKRGIRAKHLEDLLPELQIKAPTSATAQKPDFQEELRKVFRRSSKRWLSEDEIQGNFTTSSRVEFYAKGNQPDSWVDSLKKIFRREWTKLLKDDKTVSIEDEGEMRYARLPDRFSRVDFDAIAIFGSIWVVNHIWDLLIRDYQTTSEVKNEFEPLLQKILEILVNYRQKKYSPDILQSAANRDKVYRSLRLSDQIRHRIESYFAELTSSDSDPEILRSLSIRIVKLLASEYRGWKLEANQNDQGPGLESRIRELVAAFDGEGVKVTWQEKPLDLKKYDEVRREEFRYEGKPIQFDVYATRRTRRGTTKLLVAECKLRSETIVKRDDIKQFAEKIRALESIENTSPRHGGQPASIEAKFFFTSGKFEEDTIRACRENKIIPIDLPKLNELLKEHRMDRVKSR